MGKSYPITLIQEDIQKFQQNKDYISFCANKID